MRVSLNVGALIVIDFYVKEDLQLNLSFLPQAQLPPLRL
jgi:hypothetical protein